MNFQQNEINNICSEINEINEDSLWKNSENNITFDENDEITFKIDSTPNLIKKVEEPPMIENIFCNEIGETFMIREKGETTYIKKNSKDRKIKRNFNKIEKLLSSQNVNHYLIEKTKEYYIKLNKDISMQGRNINNIILGIFYYACKKAGYVKTFKQISLMFNIPERSIKKAYSSIQYYLVESPQKEEEIINIELTLIRDFIGEDVNKNELKILAFEIVKNINSINLLEGKSPKTIAGISLFLAYKLLNESCYNKNEFYIHFCSDNTLIRICDEIKNKISLIVPKEFSDKLHLL